MRCNPVAIASGCDFLHPGIIFQIPPHGLSNAALERLTRLPAQVALNLSGIHRVAAIVAGAILHERDQISVRHNWIALARLVAKRAERLPERDVPPVIPTPHVAGLSGLQRMKYGAKRVGTGFDRAAIADSR